VSQHDELQGPDTPRSCEACGGDSGDECNWCTNGFQDKAQQLKWKQIRQRMRSVSSTYTGFQGIMEAVLDRLEELGTDEALELKSEGREVVAQWATSAAGSADRDEATRVLMVFHQNALDMLQSK
jgi:hypothetical protein